MIKLVLDSYALIGYLENESFSDVIEKILNQSKNGDPQLYLHVINLGEVYYITLREKGKDIADLAYSRIRSFPIRFIDRIDNNLMLKAATLKAEYPVSYADAFAAALAQIHICPLLTGDPEFKSLEKKGVIEIAWLNAKER